jgi:hypothetical protein
MTQDYQAVVVSNGLGGPVLLRCTLPNGIDASVSQYQNLELAGAPVGPTNPLPINALQLPLPAGAATAALQPDLNVDGGSLSHVTNFPATQPVSMASELPAGSNVIGAVLAGVSGNGAPIPLLLGTRTFGSNVGIDSTIIPSVENERFFISAIVINLSGNATLAEAGVLDITINDGGNAIFQAIPFVGTAPGAPSQILLSLAGLNVISAAAGNSLTSVLNVALVTGSISIMVFGGYTAFAQ